MLFIGIANQDTQLCVSSQERCATQVCYMFTGTTKSPYSTPQISMTTEPISIKFTYFMPYIYVHNFAYVPNLQKIR